MYVDGFLALHAVEGLRARVDFARQRLIVSADPRLLPSMDIPLASTDEKPMSSASVPGLFMGYDFVGWHVAGAETGLDGELETGGFAGPWSLRGNWRVGTQQDNAAVRLDTTLIREWPDRMTGIAVGDVLTTPGSWGRVVRAGGLRWGTDFSVRPDFVTFPLPAMRGEAVLPSTIDVYVNEVLRARREVSPGVFTLHDLPVVVGAGDVRVVLRDALGRERLIEQPYFASADLLRKGLSASSIETGFVRENYGLEAFDYGRAFVTGGLRRGLTERLTGEVRAEVLERQQTTGVSLNMLLHPGVVLSTSLAGSESESDRHGGLAQLGLDAVGQVMSAGLRIRTATADFTQLGLASSSGTTRGLDAHVSFLVARAHHVGLFFAAREESVQRGQRLVSMTWSTSLGTLGYFSAFAARDLRQAGSTQVAVGVTRPMGDRTSSRVSANIDAAGTAFAASMQRATPASGGSGFHLEATRGSMDRLRAGVSSLSQAGTLTFDVAHDRASTRYLGGMSGGFVLMEGHLAAVRDTDTSFALVEVPAQSGIPIYRDRHRVAVTDQRGFAVVPGLRAHEANLLQIDPGDLPIERAVTQSEQEVRPHRRGGVHVRFPVPSHGGAVVHLLRETGEFVPAGARVVVLEEGGDESIVAGDGALYLHSVSGEVRIEATWRERRCRARFHVPAKSVLPNLGRVTCEELM
jgi:outer membrane usher protein